MTRAYLDSLCYPFSLPLPTPQALPDTPLFASYSLHVEHARREYAALNAILTEKRDLQSLSLYSLFLSSHALHPSIRTRVRVLCGSCLSHALLFASISEREQAPRGALRDAIGAQFGSLDALCGAAQALLPDYPESGWLWLARHKRYGNLRLLFYRDADFPELMSYEPLLCFDLWEHAYVRDYPDARSAYLCDCFRFAAWERAERMLCAVPFGKGA